MKIDLACVVGSRQFTCYLERKNMSVDSEPHYLDTLHKELALALGDAVWAFARIEWLTYKYIRRLSPGRVDELVGDLNFRPRISILRRIVKRRDTSNGKKERALSAIKEAEGLSEKRNIIVHNPWQIWINIDTEKFMTQIEKYSNSENNVDLSELLISALNSA